MVKPPEQPENQRNPRKAFSFELSVLESGKEAWNSMIKSQLAEEKPTLPQSPCAILSALQFKRVSTLLTAISSLKTPFQEDRNWLHTGLRWKLLSFLSSFHHRWCIRQLLPERRSSTVSPPSPLPHPSHYSLIARPDQLCSQTRFTLPLPVVFPQKGQRLPPNPSPPPLHHPQRAASCPLSITLATMCPSLDHWPCQGINNQQARVHIAVGCISNLVHRNQDMMKPCWDLFTHFCVNL